MQDDKLDIENEKEPDVNKKKKKNFYFCVANSRYFSTFIHRLINRLKIYFNISWLRVIMSYHRFNNLAGLLNGDLAAKIGQGILSKDLIYRGCNFYLPYKVNLKCVYEGKCRSKCLIYEVKCLMCDAIYIGNTQQTLKIYNGRLFLQSPNSTQERTEIRFICCQFRTEL